MPFLAEKITGMLYTILKNCTPAELLEGTEDAQKVVEEQSAAQAEKLAKRARLR
jgi:hypothetical protein